MASSPAPHPKTFVHILLTIFIGLLVASFVGLGIAAFYPAPVQPTYPAMLIEPAPPIGYPGKPASDKASTKAQQDYAAAQVKYQKDNERYNREVSAVVLVLAVLILVISLTLMQGALLIADGLLLGGVFDLVYSIIRSTFGSDARFQFAIVTGGLAVTLMVAYIKFVKPAKR
jgi:hypothetical protein